MDGHITSTAPFVAQLGQLMSDDCSLRISFKRNGFVTRREEKELHQQVAERGSERRKATAKRRRQLHVPAYLVVRAVAGKRKKKQAGSDGKKKSGEKQQQQAQKKRDGRKGKARHDHHDQSGHVSHKVTMCLASDRKNRGAMQLRRFLHTAFNRALTMHARQDARRAEGARRRALLRQGRDGATTTTAPGSSADGGKRINKRRHRKRGGRKTKVVIDASRDKK